MNAGAYDRLESGGLPVFSQPDKGMKAMRALIGSAFRERSIHVDSTTHAIGHSSAKAAKQGDVRASLPEHVSKELLFAAGVRVPVGRAVKHPPQALRYARNQAGPFVIKLSGIDIPHKSEHGLVKMGLTEPASIEKAAEELLGWARISAVEDPRVIVEEVVDGLYEVFVGYRRDDAIGPVLVLGFGGVYSELIGHQSVNLAPKSVGEVAAALRQSRVHSMLDGYRGTPPADVKALANLILRFCTLMTSRPDIAEADLNPVIVGAAGSGLAVAVDANLVST